MSNGVKVTVIPPKSWAGWATYRLEQQVHLVGETVPAGFVTDGATVPRWLSAYGLFVVLVGCLVHTGLVVFGSLIVLIPVLFPKTNRYFRAAIVHDYVLSYRYSRKYCDDTFLEALAVIGVPKWRRYLMYCGVRAYSILILLKIA